MAGDVCPHCGNNLSKHGKCSNTECPSTKDTDSQKGLSVPTQGWNKAILIAIILALIVSLVLTYTRQEDDTETAPEDTGIEGELRKAASSEYEKEIVLAEGSVEAMDEPGPQPQPPGGLDWDTMVYPGAEQKVTYQGNTLKTGERSYVSTDAYPDIKKFYTTLITDNFFKAPGMSEVKSGNKTSLILTNDTGSLSVELTKLSWDENVHILISGLDNLAEGRLKPFGGPKSE